LGFVTMLANAVRLVAAFGNPSDRPTAANGGGPAMPMALKEKVKEFWAVDENCTICVLPRDPKIPRDVTLEIRVPKRDTQITCGGYSIWPSSQVSVLEADSDLAQCEIDEIVWRKIRSLRVAADGPNRYDRTLMAVRKILATSVQRQRRLLNSQVPEFLAKYIMPYGPPLGRWYFTRDVLHGLRRVLRKLGFVFAAAAAVRAVWRWLGGHS
jgi:hypothetical protein